MKKNLYFSHCETLEALKSEYKRLCKIHHPDVGGDTATMAAINAAYDDAIEAFARGDYGQKEQHQASTEDSEAFRAAVSAVVNFVGVKLELCGSWLWASGNTYSYRERLKAAGYRWSKNKNSWYWRPGEEHTWSRGNYTMDQIRIKFGSQIMTGVNEERQNAIHA